MSSNFTYDDLNRLTKLNNYQYQLDPYTGMRKGVTEPNGRTLNWSYDGIYRLTTETINSNSVSYTLDPVGNRQQQTSNIPGISSAGPFTFDADDRLSTESYDPNGNTLKTGNRTFTYDFENRLKTMALNTDPVSVTLQYDGDGNRVAKTVGTTITRYLVDDLNPTDFAQVVEEIKGSAVQRTYTYGSQRISQNQLVNVVWTPSFYGYDGGGSVRTLTDAGGTVTDTYDYDAWGNAVNETGNTPNVYLYRGEQYDVDLGLYYQRARYLNTLTGRFLTTDPATGISIRPAMLHKYAYAASDPVNNSDPTGFAPTTEREKLTGIVLTWVAATTTTVVRILPQYVMKGTALVLVGVITTTQTVGIYQSSIDCEWTKANAALSRGLQAADQNAVLDAWQDYSVDSKCGLPVKKCICPNSTPDGKDEDMHMLPEELGPFFQENCGVNVEDLTYHVCLPKGPHRLKSGKGVHTNQNGPGTNYNRDWKNWVEGLQGKCTPDRVRAELLHLLGKYSFQFGQATQCKGGPPPFGFVFMGN